MKTCRTCRHQGQCGISGSPKNCIWYKPATLSREEAAIRAMYWLMIGLLYGTLLALMLAPGLARAAEAIRSSQDQDSDDLAAMRTLEASVAAKVKAADPLTWTAGDTALQAAFLTALAIDRGQSAYAARHDGKFEEVGIMKIFTGRHPSVRQTNYYFATCALAHTAIAYALPKPYRTIWQSFWIGVETDAINTNISAGISVRF